MGQGRQGRRKRSDGTHDHQAQAQALPRRRQIAALLVSAGVLWTVAVTAASPTAQAALQALGRQGDVALAILRHQLADGRELDAVPASVALAIGQSPLLLGGREAVGELRGQDETDTDEGADGGEDGQMRPGPPPSPSRRRRRTRERH